jgi:hypothetical protein
VGKSCKGQYTKIQLEVIKEEKIVVIEKRNKSNENMMHTLLDETKT